ncbi:MAG: hypothetical protein K0U86_08670 [Planctomycetes bacterium]|nr:hypothetical protein [Planctomycetota bacterium]MCH9724963.1 hypothetical protein [Planctomycetota bacterium]MCH9777576.1 hypothetical protein [Planctomycetota bacterium]MCH9793458.1 hypothetical protein [Planctomycetota bacterium]
MATAKKIPTSATTSTKAKAETKKQKSIPTPETKQEAATTPKTPGVRAIKSRSFYAGQVIAKHGLAAGVTDAMVVELDTAYGAPNPRESLFCLRNSWHAVRGFNGLDNPTANTNK